MNIKSNKKKIFLMEDEDTSIKNVWSYNLQQEMDNIISYIDEYPYIAMDTEFPGVVVKAIGGDTYTNMRCNVDYLKIIQIGITLADEKGRMPEPCSTWQFNFKFNINKDTYSDKSIEILRKSGIDFNRLENEGIEMSDFAQMVYTSGLIMNPNVTYITFHGYYDFGYFTKILTCRPIPTKEEEFFEVLSQLIPQFYDVKILANEREKHGSLENLAKGLGIVRIGPQHQAGSDSLITLKVFTKLTEGGNQDYNVNINKLYSLSKNGAM